MKRISTFAVSLALAASFPAKSVDIVFDPVAETNMILQYAAMLEELSVVKDQLENAKDSLKVSQGQLKALGEGVSNIGKDNLEDYTKNIPTDWRSTLEAMQRDDETGATAKAIRDEASLLDEEYFINVPDEMKASLRDRMDSEATNHALNSAVFDASGERFNRFEDLRSKIDEARDLKTINDLQARIEIENGMLMNELVRLQSMNQVLESDRRVRSETSRQEKFKMTETKY